MLLRSGDFSFETEARHAAQLERQAHGDDAETFADQPWIAALEIERRVDADRLQARRQPAGDAPQIGELEARQSRILRRLIEQQHHAAMFLILLRDVIGDLGQRLGRRNTDRHRNAGPLQHGGAQRPGMAFETRRRTLAGRERLRRSSRFRDRV